MKRFSLVVFLATVFAISAGMGAGAHPSDATSRYACGVERWAVKTLQDRPHLLENRLTTVKYLDTRRPPSSLPDTRLPFEHHVFTVIARVTFVREEADSDYHFILQERGWHMIGETPAPYCDGGATLHYRRLMARARRVARTCARARVTGVAFFDYDHGQTGVAPNAVELHLSHCRSSRSASPEDPCLKSLRALALMSKVWVHTGPLRGHS